MLPRWSQLPLTLIAATLASLATAPVCTAQSANEVGAWGPVIDFPLIAVAAALLPDGKLLIWSSVKDDNYGQPYNEPVVGSTQTVVFDPATLEQAPMTVTSTEHDMFCPGISMLPDGNIVVTGGSTAAKTSIYKPTTDTWLPGPDMIVPRGYQSSTTLSTGEIFLLGGSWSGPKNGPRPAEVYTMADNGMATWRMLSNIQADVILTVDKEGPYRADNHAWFFAWSKGLVFHAGPSTQMLWFTTTGVGATYDAGIRPGEDAMCGNAVMYDTGKILTFGGAIDYVEAPAHDSTSLITISGTDVTVEEVGKLNKARSFASAVVLPDGQVVVVGGMETPILFDDTDATLEPEIWNPATMEWTLLAPMTVPRTYHSVGILLLDGRIFVGGGGLCGNCKGTPEVNHADGQIFTPPNLYAPDGTLAERPLITLNATQAAPGDRIVVSAEQQLKSISIIRTGSVTHAVNTDQRRLELCGPFTAPCPLSKAHLITIPLDSGIVQPGYWMVFGVDTAGVPSVGSTVLITT